MIFISHRGNIDGPHPGLENSPKHINKAINTGFDVEIDVWYLDGKFILGHDSPQYEIDGKFLLNSNLWCHAKNIEALNNMLSIGAHCFWHQEDFVTLTSKGFIWTYPGVDLTHRSICVLPELFSYSKIECAGICSDEITRYRREICDKNNSI